MSLLCYLKKKPFPTVEQIGIEERATSSANSEVEEVLDCATGNRKRKHYATCTDGDRAEIRKFAVENGNMAALKHFRKEFQELKRKNKIANNFIIVVFMNIANILSCKRNRIYGITKNVITDRQAGRQAGEWTDGQTDAHTHVHAHMHTRTHTYAHTHAHMYTQTHTHTQTYTQ